ncbi:MAG TPA: tetratricopeptide repeat protein [Chthoniobacterales bacterium]|jgi:tetratricopeptide (TPR) repeat protein|nr:tetratricopeptide repeat protein [Chthoniobacterales bacterium]
MNRSPLFIVVLVVLLALCTGTSRGDEDAAIDKLIKKLPPPEKLVKPIRRAVQANDPAIGDPLVTEIAAAAAVNNLERCLNLSRKLTQHYPQSPGAQILRGFFAIDAKQYAEAGAAFHSAIGTQPKASLAYFGLALVEGRQDHYGAAIPQLQHAATIEPDAGVVYYALSDCYLHTGQKQQAVEAGKKATALEAKNPYFWIQLARAEKSLGHGDATLQAMVHGAEAAPDSGDLFAAIGFSYINLDRVPQAVPPLRRAAQLLPHDFLVQAQLGFCLQATGQIDNGIGYLRKGASLNPNYGPVWEHLGLAYQKKGNHREAISAFERATQLMPNSPRPWQHLADEYRLVGRAADAERAAGHAQQVGGASARIAKRKS